MKSKVISTKSVFWICIDTLNSAWNKFISPYKQNEFIWCWVALFYGMHVMNTHATSFFFMHFLTERFYEFFFGQMFCLIMLILWINCWFDIDVLTTLFKFKLHRRNDFEFVGSYKSWIASLPENISSTCDWW